MKIAFVNTDMHIGGIPKASIPLLKELVRNHEVTLILTNGAGDLVAEVPEGVKIEYLPSKSYTKELFSSFLSGRFLRMIESYISYKKASNWIESLRARIRLRPKKKAQYDLAIAYFGMNAKCVLVTLDCVNATKKVAFMHGDHPFKAEEFRTIESIYSEFDRLFCVSDATRRKYIHDFPKDESLFDVFYNLMDVEKIKALSQKKIKDKSFDDHSVCHIVTVGRLSPEKGQMMIPDIAVKLKNDGVKFIWHLVGEGNDREKLEKKIHDLDLQESVLLHGNALNPYPYIKVADLYVQPSYTEGYCLTIREAAILGRPIIATKVGGSWEHFTDQRDVILCESNVDSIFSALKLLVDNFDLRIMLGQNALKKDWSNTAELKKLSNL